MRSFSTFDDLGTESRSTNKIKPLWAIDFEDEKTLLEWLASTVETLLSQAEDRTQKQMVNLSAYRNQSFKGGQARRSENSDSYNTSNNLRAPRVNINYIADIVQQHVSRTTKFRPNISVLPANDEDYTDKVNAKTAEEILQALWYNIDFDRQLRRIHRIKKIFGECILFPFFNPFLGDIHPTYKQQQKAQGTKTPKIPLTDDQGQQVVGEDGKPLTIERAVRIGEIEHRIPLPWNTLYGHGETWEDVDYVLYREFPTVEELKAQHPDKAYSIKEGGISSLKPDSTTIDMIEFPGQTEVWWLFHRGTSEIDSGRIIKFTKDVILINKPSKYALFGQVDKPAVRICDLEIPGLGFGATSLDNARPVSDMIQRLTAMILRNQMMCAHPKWFMQKNSCKVESLGNDTTVVQFQGPIRPELAQANPTPREVFEFRNILKEEMFQFEGLYPIGRGEPPAGIKAFVALQFLDEQENDRANETIAEHNRFIRQVALWDLSIAGVFYDDTDDRLPNLLGDKKAREVSKYWKFANLTKPYDVQLQNSSALPLQRSAKTQFIMDVGERYPNLFPEEQAVDMLELGQNKKFLSLATVTTRSADSENDELCRTGKTTPPEKWEEHLLHYRIHLKLLGEKSSKDELPRPYRQALEDHIQAHEMFMSDIIRTLPPYLEAIRVQFPQFPIFFAMEQPPVTPLTRPELTGQAPQMPMPSAQGPVAELNAQTQGLPPETGLEMTPGMENITPTPEVPSLAKQGV